MLLYVICHDPKSLQKASEMCSRFVFRFKNLKAKPLLVDKITPFFENEAFVSLLSSSSSSPSSNEHNNTSNSNDNNEWESEDYILFLSYSFEDKMKTMYRHKGNAPFDISKIVQEMKDNEYDVMGLQKITFAKHNVPIPVLEAGTFNHGYNFYRAWYNLLKTLGYEESQILDKSVPFFVSNWWVMKPFVLREYASFLSRAFKEVESDALRPIFYQNAYYDSRRTKEETRRIFGVDYFTQHPFIFERLSGFFFHTQPHIKLGESQLLKPHKITTFI